MTDTNQNPLPAPPRPIGPRARARAWAEAPVRVWMVLTLLVGISLVYLAAQNIIDGMTERHLIYNGVPATARIIDVNGNGDPRKAVAMNGSTEDRTVHLSYPDATGKTIDSAVRVLENPASDGKRVGDSIPIRYDPDHPDTWTDRTQPTPWVARLAIVWMLLPALVFALLMLIVRRNQVLRIWREGSEVFGKVVEWRHSSIAPKSRVVRFTLEGSDNRRIISSFFPNDAGEINKGDEVLLLTSPTNQTRAIVAELYEEQ